MYLLKNTLDKPGWVSPFGNHWVKAYSQLTNAYRSVSRPSSPPSAKASTKRPYNTWFSFIGRIPNQKSLATFFGILPYDMNIKNTSKKAFLKFSFMSTQHADCMQIDKISVKFSVVAYFRKNKQRKRSCAVNNLLIFDWSHSEPQNRKKHFCWNTPLTQDWWDPSKTNKFFNVTVISICQTISLLGNTHSDKIAKLSCLVNNMYFHKGYPRGEV